MQISSVCRGHLFILFYLSKIRRNRNQGRKKMVGNTSWNPTANASPCNHVVSTMKSMLQQRVYLLFAVESFNSSNADGERRLNRPAMFIKQEQTHTHMIWLRTWTDYMCMDVFNVFHFTWRSSTNHNTGWGHILVGSEPVHSTMLTFYTLTSDGGGCPAFRHVVIEEGVNQEAELHQYFKYQSRMNRYVRLLWYNHEAAMFREPQLSWVLAETMFLQFCSPVSSGLTPES